MSLLRIAFAALSERSTAERTLALLLVAGAAGAAGAAAWASVPLEHPVRVPALGYGLLLGWFLNWVLHDHSLPWRRR